MKKYTPLLVLGLLLLRIPILNGVEFLWGPISDWVVLLFEVIWYLLLAFMIWIEKDSLACFNIDKLSLVIFLLFGTIFRTSILQEKLMCFEGLPFWIIGISLAIALWRSHVNFPAMKIGNYWQIFEGVFVGVALSVILTLPWLLWNNRDPAPAEAWKNVSISILILGAIHQLAHAAIFEEPMFRGFLWGYLRKVNWKEKWILLFQASLFWIAHINYLDRPYSFWIAVPVSGIVLGFLVWRSRSLVSAMFAHAIVNSMSYVMLDLLFHFLR